MDGTFDMDNNNSIPYGAINWNNEALASTYAQIEQRERQRESQTDSVAQFQPQPRPVVSNDTSFERQELSDSSVVGTSAAYIGAPDAASVLNFRPPVEQRRTFSNDLNGFSHNTLNGFFLQPSRTLLPHNNAGADMQNRELENQNAQYLQCRQRTGTDGAFSGQELAPGLQPISQPGANFVAGLNRGSGFAFNAGDKEKHTKRKITKDGDDDEKVGICPSRKQLITEERMAARMYNLRISNDHSYVTNGLPTGYAANRASSIGQTSRTGRLRQLRSSRSRQNRSVVDLEVEEEEDEENKRPAPTFQFAPGIKAGLSKNGSFLPDEIFRQINQPCVAIVPWRPPLDLGERLCVHNKEQTSLEAADSRENGKVEEEIITDAEPVMDIGAFNVNVTAADDDCFSLDDDMDL